MTYVCLAVTQLLYVCDMARQSLPTWYLNIFVTWRVCVWRDLYEYAMTQMCVAVTQNSFMRDMTH